MFEKLRVMAYDAAKGCFLPAELTVADGMVQSLLPCPGVPGEKNPGDTLYLCDGLIDSHAHVYDGATDLGVPADRIGLNTGVHLIIDAGSAGSINFPCFRDYVMPAHETPVKAFLNISRIGLTTKQPYHDRRVIDIPAAVRSLKEDGGKYLLGIKVLSSGLIVEDAGMEPMRAAAAAARQAGCPVMAHLTEGPPSNGETMACLEKGDIITHCFHGAPNYAALLKASRGHPVDRSYCSQDNIMWRDDGTPGAPLADALNRGVFLDVGHGAGSLDQRVARAAIAQGVRNFSISTDAHIRNVDGAVRDLPHTMSKFLAMGMTLAEVVASVTLIPARQLGLSDWCSHLCTRATLLRVRPARADDPPLLDSYGAQIDGKERIQPAGIIRSGRLQRFEKAGTPV